MTQGLTTITISLPAGDVADLEALARQVSFSRDALIQRVLGEWLEPRRSVAERERCRAAEQATKEAEWRRSIVERWEKYRRGHGSRSTEAVATERFLRRLYWRERVELSRRTLYNWKQQYEAGGIDGLIDGRGTDYGGKRYSHFFLRELARLYILSDGKPSVKACYEEECRRAEKAGWSIMSLTVARRYLYA